MDFEDSIGPYTLQIHSSALSSCIFLRILVGHGKSGHVSSSPKDREGT